jgi:hypothetical protein
MSLPFSTKRALDYQLMLALILLISVGILQQGAVAGPKKQTREAEADDLFTNATLHVLKMNLPDTSAQSLRRQPRKYVPATLQEGTILWTNVLVRLKGGAGSFRNLEDKPGFTVKLDDSISRFHGLKKFHLNNSVQDPTYLKEWIGNGIFRDAGVPAARAAHAVLELNGQRLGQYVLLEAINSDFLAQYFEHSHGNVYGQRSNADVNQRLARMGGREETQRRELQALASAAEEPDLDQLRVKLPQVLDMKRFISFFAVEVMLDQWDGYALMVKNYEVYHNIDTDRLVFMPHDLDQIFRNVNAPIMPQPPGMVARSILRDPITREAYRKRFCEICTNFFVAPVLTKRVDERVAKLAPELRNYDPEMASVFVRNSARLNDRILGRAHFLARQLQLEEPGRVVLTNNSILITGWRVANEQKNAKQDEVRGPSGDPAFWISAQGPSAASWRAKVFLEPGHYLFEGEARSSGVQPVRNDAKGAGAGLRISGGKPQDAARLLGDVPTRKLRYEFTVTPESGDTDLICELRAEKGEVWFDEHSLRVLRLN